VPVAQEDRDSFGLVVVAGEHQLDAMSFREPSSVRWHRVWHRYDMATDAPDSTRAGGNRWFRLRLIVVRIFYGALTALLTYTLVAQLLLTHHQHRSIVNTFSYFTIQSNVLVWFTALVLCMHPSAASATWRATRLGALCGITVTGVVYATVIAPYVHLSGWALAYDYVFHYVVPLVSVVGFILVGPRTRFVRRDIGFLIWPVLWLVYTMVRGGVAHPEFVGFGEAPSHYPYRFLDIDRVSVVEVVGAVLLIAALLTCIGFTYIWAEHRLAADPQ
jgi:hypothetical protein